MSLKLLTFVENRYIIYILTVFTIGGAVVEQQNSADKYKNKIITIPNILSFFRLCLIPPIVILYLGGHFPEAGLVVLLSGLTDILDGFIARTFNMISDIGKVLDPIADKTTQGVVMILLALRFPLMLLPIVMTVIKESFMALTGSLIIKKTGIVLGAEWHGKAATVLLTATMALHIFWYDIPFVPSAVSISLSALMILISLILYTVRNIGYLTKK